MSTYTMFLDPQVSAYPTNAPDPFFSAWCDTFNTQSRFNVKAKYLESITLDATDQITFSFNAAATDWVIFLFRVVGEAKFSAVCKDSDNTTSITGTFPTTGVTYFPGYIIWSTQRYVSGATITGITDGTSVEAMILIAEEDS